MEKPVSGTKKGRSGSLKKYHQCNKYKGKIEGNVAKMNEYVFQTHTKARKPKQFNGCGIQDRHQTRRRPIQKSGQTINSIA